MGCFLVSKFTSHRLYPSNEGHGPESPGPWLTLQVTGFICRVPPSGTTHTQSRHTTNNRRPTHAHVQNRQGTSTHHMHAVLLQIIHLNCIYYYYHYYTQLCLHRFQTLSAWPGHGPHPAWCFTIKTSQHNSGPHLAKLDTISTASLKLLCKC